MTALFDFSVCLVNISVYVNNGPCIAQAQAPTLNCSAQAIEDLSDVDEGGLTLGEILDELCRYTTCKVYCRVRERCLLARLSQMPIIVIGEFIGYAGTCRPSVVRPSVRQHFQTNL